MKRAVLVCLVLTFCLASPAGAATYTVNTTADTTVAGGCDTNPTCSIRDALNIADNATGNTVALPAGRYELNTPAVLGALQLGSDTDVIGAGARSTIIDANGESRVFNAFGTNRIEGVTITGGAAVINEIALDFGDGGGIITGGDFTLVNSTVTGNTAQFSGGGVATGTPFEGNDPGPVTIIGSTISNNTVEGGAVNGQGGGVSAFSDLTMINTTVTGNSAENVGVSNQGGGVVATDGAATLRNVTIASNTTTGILDLGAGFAGDDIGGIPPADSELTATNTIIAGNTHNGAASDCGLVDVVATDNNISSDDSCDFGDAGSKENTNPQLGALANNGGQTDTRKFAQGAPPYNAGVPTGCPGTDQRGVTRPQQGACDIGAVEIAPPTATTGGFDDLTATGATVFGSGRNPFILAGTATFEYGTSTAYGRTVPSGGTGAALRQTGATPAVAPGGFETESAALRGLAPGTVYHYRLVVQNGDGISRGEDRTFTTGRVLARPRVSVAGVSRSCVRRAFTLRVRARVASGTRLKAVRVTLDGRTIKRSTRRSFTVRVNAAPLRSGRHTLRIKAVDRGNRTRTVTRRFRRCARVPSAQPRFTG